MTRDGSLLEVDDLAVHFPVGGRLLRSRNSVKAVDGVSFHIEPGETLGLVGESGCGKSTAGLALLQLEKPTRGRVVFDGEDVTQADGGQLRALRRRMAMVFQDPHASLNPRRTVGDAVAEPLVIHGLGGDGRGRARRVEELLETVGIAPEARERYPHEFSGGQRQRIGIARALACEPDLLICDEPIASLDVSIQAQVLNLLVRLQRDLGLSLLFIAHDLAAVQHIADRIAVMYLGRIVEIAEREALVTAPKHPYTQALLSAVPLPDPPRERQRRRIVLEGDMPSPMDPPAGCNFNTRCPEVHDACHRVDPALQQTGGSSDAGHQAACHLYGVVGERVDDGVEVSEPPERPAAESPHDRPR